MKKYLLLTTLLLTLMAIFSTCKKDLPVVEPFNEEAMLDHWANNIILPAHKAFNTSTKTLNTQAQAFVDDPRPASLEAVRTAWFESYVAWQHIPSIRPYGWGHNEEKEEDQFIFRPLYRNTNPYPTDVDRIRQAIAYADFDSTDSKIQGLPALEFMLYGLANTDSDILANYKETSLDAEKNKNYLLLLTNRLQLQSNVFFNHFRDKLFVMDTGQMDKACPKKLISEYAIFFYSLDIQFSKIGYPSCEQASSNNCGTFTRERYVEGRFSRIYSKTLLLEALNTAQDFYNGVPFRGSFEERSNSLYQYLDLLNTQKDGQKLCDLINDQFDKTRTEIDKLNDDLGSEAKNKTVQIINVYNQLERNRELLRINMLEGVFDAYSDPFASFSCK